jgi:2-polyprenyl-3-methyl-5-hydroxy-6-metoxy-1,4-benzoquinol methylase
VESWIDSTAESRERWEKIANCWDSRMGDSGNRHSLELVFPATEQFLGAKPGERILDAACGNGTFSRRLASLGCQVLAFDYSSAMIEHAITRSSDLLNSIEYKVTDATDINALLALGEGTFDKAVCNMAIHDISDIQPLFKGICKLLKPGGVFVFSTMHPCFKTAGMQKVTETIEDENGISELHAVKIYNYITPKKYYGYAIGTQPVPHLYYHRPISVLLQSAFDAGFAVSGVAEPVFEPETVANGDWTEIPAVLVVKLFKMAGGDINHERST